MEYIPSYTDDLYLAHHGIKGQKWGVRRYQNPDGSLTDAGRKRIISEHERRGRAIGRVAGKIGGYFLYDNSDAIASKVSDKSKETVKRIGNTKPVAKASEAAKNVGKKVSDKIDNDTTKKIRNKAGEVISVNKDTIKRGADKAKEIKKSIDDDPLSYYYMSDLASDVGGIFGERIGAAAGRKIGEASASIQSAYGRHKVKQLMKKNRHVKHADIYSDYLMHHGIRGMHWGVRRFEDYSGHLTSAGKRRYDKYDYDTKPASASSKKTKRSSKKGMTLGQKAALGAGLALTAYGAAKIYKGKKTFDGMKNHIASTHASELEGLDPKKRDRILKRVTKEQLYEADRVEKIKKSKDPDAEKKAKRASEMLTDEHISSRINKLKPKKLRTKTPKTSNSSKPNNQQSTERQPKAKSIFGSKSKTVAVKKKPGQASSETIAIRNANRLASMNRARGVETYSQPTQKSKPVASKTESADIPKKSRAPKKLFKSEKKKSKPKKKRDPIETAMKAGKAFNTIKAVNNRDYGQAVYNIATEVIEATDKRIAKSRRKQDK